MAALGFLADANGASGHDDGGDAGVFLAHLESGGSVEGVDDGELGHCAVA